MFRHVLTATVVVLSLSAPAFCQIAPPPAKSLSLAGPRFGLTSLSQGVVDKLAERSITVRPVITQFGWQTERQFFTTDSGFSALNEWVLLLGGLEQGVALPSVSWLVGFRTREGAEIGVGPNITPAGVALAFAGGMTLRTGVVNVPMNVAVVPSHDGTRISFLTGFTLRK
jgi:hypothetical protein